MRIFHFCAFKNRSRPIFDVKLPSCCVVVWMAAKFHIFFIFHLQTAKAKLIPLWLINIFTQAKQLIILIIEKWVQRRVALFSDVVLSQNFQTFGQSSQSKRL